VKPANCILALTAQPPPSSSGYDWYDDSSIWSSKDDGIKAVRSNKWKLMLVDFGFARALEKEEIDSQPKKLRNSIALESSASSNSFNGVKDKEGTNKSSSLTYKIRMINETIPEDGGGDDDSIAADMAALESIVASAAEGIRKSVFEPTNADEEAIMGVSTENLRKRLSGISMALPEEAPESTNRRSSTTRKNVRSMSALGTKAYAAPEIRKQLRNKTASDFEKANAAMTECVADYGMIVDAYSVGWTLRVAMTGVPPNFSISEYVEERENVVIGDDEDDEMVTEQCCCFSPLDISIVRIRDPSMLPPAALLMITRMTEKNPEDRMTVREAQNDIYILPSDDEKGNKWVLPVGDVPSQHGDPVVPLKCAGDLSRMTGQYWKSAE
jgi:serine/threonine protein kinase